MPRLCSVCKHSIPGFSGIFISEQPPNSCHDWGVMSHSCPAPLHTRVVETNPCPTPSMKYYGVVQAQPPPPSAYTQPYAAEGFFTGVRSSICVQRSPAQVYDSLSRDLHQVFGPITECVDTVEEDDGCGRQVLFRVVRIPFRVLCVSGNLKMRLRVQQDRRTRQVSMPQSSGYRGLPFPLGGRTLFDWTSVHVKLKTA